MRISRSEFVKEITSKPTIFLGVTKRLYSKDELSVYVVNLQREISAGIMIEMRTATARSHDIVFPGGSHLSLIYMEFNKYEFSGDSAVLMCTDKESGKTMYYYMGE